MSFEGRPHLAKPTVLVADDHSRVLAGVLSLLMPHFDVIGAVNNGNALVEEAHRLEPDVIVLDITMPILNGIEAAHALLENGTSAKLVFLTVYEDSSFVQACFEEGAMAYVAKSRMATDLIPAINEALSGHRFISPTVPRG
jgi:DNA-binding NarL/FixJ family response regulator